MAGTLIVRPEKPGDYGSIDTVHATSFPNREEADLVIALRQGQHSRISVVAEINDVVVGHCVCSEMISPAKTLGLGPVAVLPKYRKHGVAAGLITHAIEMAKQADWAVIFVLGNPTYYRRFGFSRGAAKTFNSVYAGSHFMVLEFPNHDLNALDQAANYAHPFAQLS